VRVALRDVVAFACEVGADYQQFPKDWLFHYRWDKGKGGPQADSLGNKIVYDTVGGRTTAIVEAIQGKKDWGKPAKAKASSTGRGKGKGKGKGKDDGTRAAAGGDADSAEAAEGGGGGGGGVRRRKGNP